MKVAGKRKKRNTFRKARNSIFTRTYVAYSIRNHLLVKYKIDGSPTSNQFPEQLISKRSIPEISKLSKVLMLDKMSLRKFILFNKVQSVNAKNDIEMLKVYLAIENEIIALAIAKKDKYSLISEDYERAVLSPAIERAVGNKLKNIEDDLVFQNNFDELHKRYQRQYYQIAYKYKLPTPRLLAFILRLIS